MNRTIKRRFGIGFNPTLMFAQVVIKIARTYISYLARFGPPEKRETYRHGLKKIDAMHRTEKRSLAMINQGKTLEGIEELDEEMRRQKPYEAHTGLEDTISRLRSLQEASDTRHKETDALKQIRDEVGENTPALIARYRDYLEFRPESTIALSALAGALRKNGEFDAALETLQKSIDLATDRGYAPIATRLAYYDVLREKGCAAEAEEGYRAILSTPSPMLDRMKPIVYLYLGDALKAQGKIREAQSTWQQTIKLAPTAGLKKELKQRLQSL